MQCLSRDRRAQYARHVVWALLNRKQYDTNRQIQRDLTRSIVLDLPRFGLNAGAAYWLSTTATAVALTAAAGPLVTGVVIASILCAAATLIDNRPRSVSDAASLLANSAIGGVKSIAVPLVGVDLVDMYLSSSDRERALLRAIIVAQLLHAPLYASPVAVWQERLQTLLTLALDTPNGHVRLANELVGECAAESMKVLDDAEDDITGLSGAPLTQIARATEYAVHVFDRQYTTWSAPIPLAHFTIQRLNVAARNHGVSDKNNNNNQSTFVDVLCFSSFIAQICYLCSSSINRRRCM